MSDKTAIEWTDATWNPIRGCSRVSEGCRNCYAETVANRFKGPGQPYEGLVAKGGQWNGTIKWVGGDVLEHPLRWSKPRRIFVNSMSDLFHENVPDEVIDRIFAVMWASGRHTFQVLTKRPERMRDYLRGLTRADGKGPDADRWDAARKPLWNAARGAERERIGVSGAWPTWPLPNVWLGVSVEDQKTADERIPHLLATPAAVRWISAEPLLRPVDLRRWLPGKCQHPQCDEGSVPVPGGGVSCPWCQCGPSNSLDWIVVGGESGPHARPMHPDWARSLRDQCAAAGVPFLFKQWGEWAPGRPGDSTTDGVWMHPNGDTFGPVDGEPFYPAPMSSHVVRLGKKNAGRLLDGVQHDGYPAQQPARGE